MYVYYNDVGVVRFISETEIEGSTLNVVIKDISKEEWEKIHANHIMLFKRNENILFFEKTIQQVADEERQSFKDKLVSGEANLDDIKAFLLKTLPQ